MVKTRETGCVGATAPVMISKGSSSGFWYQNPELMWTKIITNIGNINGTRIRIRINSYPSQPILIHGYAGTAPPAVSRRGSF